jgi:hypothetical protein
MFAGIIKEKEEQYVKKLSPDNAGLTLISQPMMQALLSPISGGGFRKINHHFRNFPISSFHLYPGGTTRR